MPMAIGMAAGQIATRGTERETPWIEMEQTAHDEKRQWGQLPKREDIGRDGDIPHAADVNDCEACSDPADYRRANRTRANRGRKQSKIAQHDARVGRERGYAGDPHEPADREARRWPERLAGVEVRSTCFSEAAAHFCKTQYDHRREDCAKNEQG